MAKLYFRYGAMNCGKSALLQQVAHNYEERKMKVAVMKPSVDTREQGYVVSRVGLKRKVNYNIGKDDSLVSILADIVQKKISCVLVDEAQFLSEKQIDELYIFTKKYDIAVICYGLRTDFTSHMFTGSKRLLELADSIEELHTICECGKRARFNARLNKDGEYLTVGDQISIDDGSNDTYNSLCGECYFKKVLRRF